MIEKFRSSNFSYLFNYITHWSFGYQLATFILTYYACNIIWFYFKRYKRYQIFKYYGIPGPELSLLDGHATEYLADIDHFKFDKKMWLKYGKTWAGFLGDGPIMITSDRKILNTIFVQNHPAFSERIAKVEGLVICQGIFGCSRDRWKLFRKIFTTYFARFTKTTDASLSFIENASKLMLEYLDQRLSEITDKGGKVNIDLFDLVKSQTLYTVSEIAVKIPVQVQEKQPLVSELDNYIMNVISLPFRLCMKFPWLSKVYAWQANFVSTKNIVSKVYDKLYERIDIIRERIKHEHATGTKPPDNEFLIDILIRLEERNNITTGELLGNAESILFAGYDATSTTIIYALWAISRYQEVQKRLYEEVLIYGSESKYLEQVIQESMRLWPAVDTFVTRLATKTVEINGVTIPEGTLVIFSAMIQHRNPAYWRNPDKFDPERFIDPNKIDSVYYGPFGLGERKCVAAKMVTIQIKIFISQLILKYEMQLRSPKEMDLAGWGMSMTKPREKIIIDFIKRSHVKK